MLPHVDLAEVQAREQALIGEHAWGWVDSSHQFARIPVQQAMNLAVKQGLPTDSARDAAISAALYAASQRVARTRRCSMKWILLITDDACSGHFEPVDRARFPAPPQTMVPTANNQPSILQNVGIDQKLGDSRSCGIGLQR